MIESIYDGSSHWRIDRTFASMDAAKAYIAQRKAEYSSYYNYDVPEFDIRVEDVWI